MQAKIKLNSLLLLGLVIILASSIIACQSTQPLIPTPKPSTKAPQATLTEVTMASEVDSFSVPVKITNEFTDNIETIYLTAKLNNAPVNTEVRAEWIYIKGERSELLNVILFDNQLVENGNRRIKFSQIKSVTGWPLGEYKVLLYLNGEKIETVFFSIIAAPRKELMLLYDKISEDYFTVIIRGKVKNVGTVPLYNVNVKTIFFNSRGAHIGTDWSNVSMETDPLEVFIRRSSGINDIIGVSEEASFDFLLEEQWAISIRQWEYRFISDSGEEIPFKRAG